MMKGILMSKVSGRKLNKIISVILICLVFTVCCFSAAFASGDGEEAHPSLLKTYAPAILNFLILVTLLAFMMKKMDIKGYFKKRTELIEQSLREAREAKELAQKALSEVEGRLKVRDEEINGILDAAKESGNMEKRRIVNEGMRLKARIIEQMKGNIDFEVRRAKDAIKQEAVEIAMELAEKKLKDKLTKEEQARLLEESISKIEGKN